MVPRLVRWALLGTAVTGCLGRPRTAPFADAAAPACPAPVLDVERWSLTHDSADVTYRVPDGFIDRASRDLPYRHWTYDDRSFGSLSIGFHHGSEHWLTLRRVPSPEMHEMTECLDSVAGREVLVQAWRMAGGIFRGGRRRDRYEVFALLPISPGLTVYITGGGSDRRFQEMLLSIVRTVRMAAP